MILVQSYGMLGVFLGTMISFLSINIWYDPFIVHKYGLEKSPRKFYFQTLKTTIITILMGIVLQQIKTNLDVKTSLLTLVIQAAIVTLIIVLIYFITNRKSKEFKYVCNKVKSFISK
jgi:hypothetical protein